MGSETRSKKQPSASARKPPEHVRSLSEVSVDRYRAFVFPNLVRELRLRQGFQKLMALSERIPEIPYIRLSKIERGEVVARADELVRIGHALGIAADQLMVDIDAPTFDMAAWAEPFHEVRQSSEADERTAVLLGAALRVRRNQDRSLTIAVLEKEYGLPAVVLSRIENAQKTPDRWNAATLASLCRLLGATDLATLRETLTAQFVRGELDGYVGTIANPAQRIARTRQKIGALRDELVTRTPDAQPTAVGTLAVPDAPAQLSPDPSAATPSRTLRVYGAPLPGGLIANVATDGIIEAPCSAGPRAFGLRVCRATLGPGLPANATVIVDPDRAPAVGGIAAIRSDQGYRLVTTTFDRTGVTMGYSVSPDVEINIDDLDPADVAGVVCAVFP